MWPYLAAICLMLCGCTASNENQEWDLAVAIEGQIELLTSNGTLVGTTISFNKLKALTFDNIRHQFIVSDMNELNDTIYSIPLTSEEQKNDPIVEDLEDDIQGLAIDPLNDVLYWSNPKNRAINYISLKNPEKSGVFMSFKDEQPQDLAIDSCRRYIYWTNSNLDKPSIDRAKLDGSAHEVLIEADLKNPVGIAIDFINKRLYWADMGEGIYFKIESSSLEGKERDIIVEETHQKPFGLAVDEESIYWTDVNNNALWKIRKQFAERPSRVKGFKERPLGIIAKHLGFMESPDCSIIEQAIRDYNQSTTEYILKVNEDEVDVINAVCLNNGEMTENGCVCRRGFKGPNCEIQVCHNYCVHGNCELTTHGYPTCHCKPGFTGSRCEYDLCYKYCFNNGTCNHNGKEPHCECPSGFIGDRCEVNLNILAMCDVYCENPKAAEKTNHSITCNCDSELRPKMQRGEYAETQIRRVHMTFSEYLTDPAFLILCICMLVTMLIVVGLVAILMKMRRRGRPRINKRIIVNKNVTPLTYSRPQPTVDQCEITIENCCNMNVCETPCFEPPQLRKSKNAKDEKKNLLKNMETGDDLY